MGVLFWCLVAYLLSLTVVVTLVSSKDSAGAPPRVDRQNKSAHRSACAFAVPYGTEVYEKGEDECKVEGGKQKTMRYC